MTTGPVVAIDLPSAEHSRVYRSAPGWRLALLTAGVLGIGAAVTMGSALMSLRLQGAESPPNNLWPSLLSLVPLGLYAIARALRYRVVLSADRIELIQPLGRRRMLREDIHGWRLQRNQYCATLELVPWDRKTDSIWIPLVFKTDDIWRAWYSTLEDLDSKEGRDAEDALINRLYPFLPADEGVWRMVPLRRLAGWLNVASILLIFTALAAVPAYLTVLACTLLPVAAVGLVARFQPLYRFGGLFNDPYPSLLLPLVLPGIVMFITVVSTYPLHPLHWMPLVVLAFVLGTILARTAIVVDPWVRAQNSSFLFLSVFLWQYGCGAALGSNAFADHSTARVYPVTIISKHTAGGGRGTSLNLHLMPWGPFTYGDDATVTGALYRSVKPGDTVCVYLKRGALRIPWYRVDRCESL